MMDVYHEIDVVGEYLNGIGWSGIVVGRGAAAQPRYGQGLSSSATSPAAVQFVVYKGKPCTRLTSVSSGVNSSVYATGYKATPLIERPVTDLRVVPAAAVWSISTMIAWAPAAAVPANTVWGQCGVGLGPSDGGSTIGLQYPGCGFTLDNPLGQVQWYARRRQNGFMEMLPVVWPVPLTEWCPVEFRVYSATPTSDAMIRVIVAGRVLIERRMTGDNTSIGVPLYGLPGSSDKLGYGLTVHNQSDGKVPALYMGGYRYIAAEAEDAL